MKEDDLLFALGKGESLSMERVANLLIPLMGAIYTKQQLAEQAGTPMELPEAFRAVVKDIFLLSSEVVALDKKISKRKQSVDDDLIN